MRAVYSGLAPDSGYNGDEDQGSMSCLAVAMKTGLFQLDGGVAENPVYQIGSPIFDEVTMHLLRPDGKKVDFVISCVNNSDSTPVVRSMKLNGKPYAKSVISHSEIIRGGKLELEF